jgi:hypothetical protein
VLAFRRFRKAAEEYTGAETAVASHDACYLGDPDAVFESCAMTVAVVDF